MRTMVWRTIVTAAIAAIGVVPCSFAQSRTPEGIVDQFVQAWNSHDMSAFERLFTADADWVTTYDVMNEGRVNVVGDFKMAHEGWAGTTTVTPSKVSVRRLRRDVAVVHFNAMLSRGPDNPPAGRTMLVVAVNQPDGWRIASGQITKPNCSK